MVVQRLAIAFILPLAILLPTDRVGAQESNDRETRLAEYLSQTEFVGKFTIDGQESPPKTETYTISSCEKLPTPDLYRLKARIKYGDIDQEVPLDLKILWSGHTPVITLDAMWIPGMGTFDARVMIRSGRYAGTWQHGDKGGHLFGKIVPIKGADEPAQPKDSPASGESE
ncbi:hypothetical protein FYK55_10680 [Roseiconus nitratireducens]|uniref:Uncharacterized protein n=1 Tax=Roseiconus nitratireducens TaxID=2605748 RepID=A0A5M6DBG9_9BACT|nr:hypothetical protein [Roseiconus nitratireducens]KAA5543662.1 hypothetical protein FYK55_10680 [Roseiconus nitratireducens]